ncbi:hypothetical protein GCM10025331_83450 [Actinoplanes utahensis]
MVSVLFWGCLAALAVLHTAGPGLAVGGRWLLAVFLTAIALAWPALRWRRGAGRWPVTAVFLVLSVLAAMVDGTGVSLFLMLIALAIITLVFGPRAGAATTAGLTAVQFAAQLLLVHRPPGAAAYEAFAIALYGVFVMTLATAVNEARAARDHADRLRSELAEAHQELQRYADRVHDLAVAEERVRMARDLHDSIGHHLTVIKVGLENADRWHDRDPAAAREDVRQARSLTGEALREIRRVVRALRPAQLDGRRGSEALRELARTFDGTGLEVDVTVDGAERPLAEPRENALFRALQESLTNALRHSGGSRVTVRLRFAPDAVRLSVTDDGNGAGGAPPGFGLTSLAGRVRAAGGALRTGDTGSGFRVCVDLPEPA